MREKTFRNIVSNAVIALVLIGLTAVSLAGPLYTAVSGGESKKPYYNGDTTKPNMSLMINVYWGTEFIEPMMNVMKEKGVSATFFVGGSWAAKNDALLKKMVDNGFEIGSHGYNHYDHKKLSDAQNQQEILVTHKLIESIAGVTMNLFAPPSGSFNQTTLKVAGELGYRTVMWTRDTIDWRDKDQNLVFTRATSKQKNGNLILMHPTAHTLAALPGIIETLKSAGYSLVTVTENIGSA